MEEEVACKNCGTVYLVAGEKISKRPKDYLSCLTCGERLFEKPRPKTLYFIKSCLKVGAIHRHHEYGFGSN